MTAADPRGLHPPVSGQVGGSEREPLHAWRGATDLLDVGHAAGRLEDGVHQDRPVQAGLRLELGEQPVDVRDVLGALHLRHHHHVEPVADRGDQGGQVVEHPGAVEGVDARPELRRPAPSSEAGRGLRDRHQSFARGHLVVGLDGVLEVAEQDVDGAGQLRHLGRHLRVGRVEEVDGPGRSRRDLAERLGGADRERAEEVLGTAGGHGRNVPPLPGHRYDALLTLVPRARSARTSLPIPVPRAARGTTISSAERSPCP